MGKPGPSSIPLPRKPDTFPTKPKTAIQMFTSEKRSSVDDLSKIAEMWRSLSGEERGVYDDKAREAGVEYEKEMKAFKSSEEGRKFFKESQLALRKRKVLVAKLRYLTDLPKKPKVAVHTFFAQKI